MSDLIGFIGRDVSPPKLTAERLHTRSNSKRDEDCRVYPDYAAFLGESGPRREHPYLGVRNLNLQPPDRQRLRRQLTEAETALMELRAEAGRICERSGTTPPGTLGRHRLSH